MHDRKACVEPDKIRELQGPHGVVGAQTLKIAPSDESAKYVENRIWSLWLAAGGDTATLLMGRVKTAMDGKDYDLALKLLNAVIDIRVGVRDLPSACDCFGELERLGYTVKRAGG